MMNSKSFKLNIVYLKRWLMKRIILIAFLCGMTLTAAAQNRPAEQRPPSTAPVDDVAAGKSAEELRRTSFEMVWRTVKEKHFDPKFGGVDWDKVRERYAPRLSEVKSDRELYVLLQQMLDELKQSHFRIIPPEAMINESNNNLITGGIGVDLQIIEGRAVITRVEPDSPAARAGLKSGFLITQIDDKSTEQVGGQIRERMAMRKESAAMADFMLVRMLNSYIKGKSGTSVSLKYLDERDQARAVTVERERLNGELSQPFGNFPAQYTEFEAKRLAGGVGYIRFNIWVTNQMVKLRAAVREMSNAPGLIIDLRGNPGGFGGMAPGLAGLLETRHISLGSMHMRTSKLNFGAIPQPNAYTGPVAILIDFGSASTSEVFAAGMQENERAVVVGERSIGAALPSYFEKLPTGARFQYAIADFKTPKGVLIEGRGVIPDVEIKHTRSALLDGRDAPLEAAVERLRRRARIAPAAQPQTSAPDFKVAENLEFRSARIISEGVRLHAEIFSLKSQAGKPLPTIIMAHGWGGTAANFRRDAMELANAGYLVVTFDYRGWGQSDGRIILNGPPEKKAGRRFSAQVEELREYVDPIEQTTDWFNVINWAMGEPMVDKSRIGLRGSSYSGGHVFYVAARDPRVKAIVSQVGAFDSRWVGADPKEASITYDEATKRARGEMGYPEPRARVIGNLNGAPIRDKMLHYAPVEEAAKIKGCAALFIVAENEELFDNKDHAKLAYDRMPVADKKYVSIPKIKHYGIYFEERNQAIKLAVEWFDQYLKK
jgi:C-terminal peptidase prc